MLCDEIEELASCEKISVNLDTLNKITDTIKNIDKIEMLDTESYGDWEARGRYSRDDYNRHGGMSYGRHYVRGHYSRDDFKSRSVERLRELARSADGKEKRVIENAISEIERI